MEIKILLADDDILLRNLVKEVLEEYGVECAKIRIIDRGALDCTIRARVATAVLRAGGED